MGEDWTKIEATNYEFWKPMLNDEIIGKVTEIKEGMYGDQHVLEVAGKDVPVMLPSHKQLQTMLKEIKEGDIVKVRLVKQEPPKVRGENSMNVYEVFKR